MPYARCLLHVPFFLVFMRRSCFSLFLVFHGKFLIPSVILKDSVKITLQMQLP